ncbi:conserved hypothetical protein [Clostridium botulinum C str. Eklund]|nr:conserved hypothetical protein [Clostridium botulinum C str. Eklund]
MKYFLDPQYKSVHLTNNYLTITSKINGWQGARTVQPINTSNKDKVYLECYINNFNANNSGIALLSASDSLDYHSGYYYWSDGNNAPKWQIGDTISVLYDKTINNGTLTFWRNGVPTLLQYTNLNTKILYLGIIVYDGAEHQQITINFGCKPFVYNKPHNCSSLDDNSKYLIRQNNKYYSLKSSSHELGQPKDNIELEKWYKENGVDDLNILIEQQNSKLINFKLDKNALYKTITPIDFNEITDKIEYINEDNKKEIKYNTEQYQLLDLVKKGIGGKFQIGKWEEKERR